MAYRQDKRQVKQSPWQSAAPNEVKPFDREIELAKLIGLWPSELRDISADGTARVVGLLQRAIRLERKRGERGHWTYDLNRHIALSNALKAEQARLRDLKEQANQQQIADRSSPQRFEERTGQTAALKSREAERYRGLETQPASLRASLTAPSS